MGGPSRDKFASRYFRYGVANSHREGIRRVEGLDRICQTQKRADHHLHL
jgi:hypothetical protein